MANLPYNVAVPVLLNMLERFPSIRHGLVMVQEEVADRLAAVPGGRIYGVPSVKAAWYAEVTKAGVIGTNVFWPAPKIHSGLVRFVRREPPQTAASRAEVFAVIDAAFAQRRKTLRAALSSWAGSGALAEEALRAAGVDPQRRGETLTVEEFARIAEHRPESAPEQVFRGAAPVADPSAGEGRAALKARTGSRDKYAARARASQEIAAQAPGKINVSLVVGPKRPDGYHSLASLFLAVSLEETVTLRGDLTGDLTLSLDPASDSRLGLQSVPLDERNIIHAAVRAVAERSGRVPGTGASAEAVITKRVPVAGGMGGGSADAAAALVAANGASRGPLSPAELHELAAGLGADVPFALEGGAAVGLGVGDRLTPVSVGRPLHWVLVPSDRGLSTREVFRRLDELREARGEQVPEPSGVPEALLSALAAGDAVSLAGCLRNDLQEAALDLAPELAETLALGAQAGALAGLVSGSGPTLAFLARDADDAARLAEALVSRGCLRAVAVHGPVPGARVVPQETSARVVPPEPPPETKEPT